MNPEDSREYKIVPAFGPELYFDTTEELVECASAIPNIPWSAWSKNTDGEWVERFKQGGQREKAFVNIVLGLATGVNSSGR